MRHRAPRPIIDLCRRLPLATAHRLGSAVRNGPVRAAVALVAVVGLGVGGYVASMVGGPSAPPTGAALRPAAPEAGPSQPAAGTSPSGRAEPDVAGQQSASESPEAAAPTERPPDASPTSQAPRSVRETLRSVPDPPSVATSTPSTVPSPSDPALPSPLEDLVPPRTLLSEEFPEPDAALFSLGANEAASFTCSLDGARYTSCGTPTRYSDLAPGWHTFAVRATDDAGNVDRTPAETRWHATAGQSD